MVRAVYQEKSVSVSCSKQPLLLQPTQLKLESPTNSYPSPSCPLQCTWPKPPCKRCGSREVQVVRLNVSASEPCAHTQHQSGGCSQYGCWEVLWCCFASLLYSAWELEVRGGGWGDLDGFTCVSCESGSRTDPASCTQSNH